MRGQGIGEGEASVTMATPGFKGSERGAEAWHHMAGSQSLERSQERLLVKVQLRSSTDTNMEIAGPWDDCQEKQQVLNAVALS